MDPIEHPTPEPEDLERSELRALLAKRDAPGLVRIGTQLLVFFGSGIATVTLAARDESTANPLMWLAMIVCGLVLATFFAPEHEAGHGTAFATPWLNTLTSWWCSAVMLQAPSFFKEFHWQHHRKTQDRAEDPEIASAPDLLDDWPRNPLVYLALASGVMLMIGKLMLTLTCALLPAGARAWTTLFPWMRERKRRRIAWESRLILAGLVGATVLGLRFVPGIWALLCAWPIAHLALGLYLMAEHTGLPNDGTQLRRTRTIETTAWVRWWMWNMPYHAEHHRYPAVPFHAVPAVHARLAPTLPHRCAGYWAFHREALGHVLRGRRESPPT